jgi:hypothetical protein
MTDVQTEKPMVIVRPHRAVQNVFAGDALCDLRPGAGLAEAIANPSCTMFAEWEVSGPFGVAAACDSCLPRVCRSLTDRAGG